MVDVARFLAARRAALSADASDAPIDPRASRAALTRALALPGADDVHVVARVLDVDGAPLRAGQITLSRDGVDVLTLPLRDGLASGPLPPETLQRGALTFDVRANGVPLAPLVLRVGLPLSGAPAPDLNCALAPGPRRAGPPAAHLGLLVAALAAGALRRPRGRPQPRG